MADDATTQSKPDRTRFPSRRTAVAPPSMPAPGQAFFKPNPRPVPPRSRRRTVGLWTLSIIMAALFAFSAVGKFGNEGAPNGGTWESQFAAWGLPGWAYLVVATVELAGAIALLGPAVRFFGAVGLVGVMLGASLTHLANAEVAAAGFPLVLALPLAAIAWLTRPAWLPFGGPRPAQANA